MLKRRLFFITAALLVLWAQPAVQAQPETTALDYMDLFEFQFIGNPRISPDGNTILFEKHQYNAMTDGRFSNIWSISFSGEDARPLTSGTSSNGNAVWSPDGSRIAYTSSAEGRSQIFIRWMDTGVTSSITHLTESPSGLQWSPDGKYILYSKFVPGASTTMSAKIPASPAGASWEKPAVVVDKAVYRRDGGSYVKNGHTHLFLVSAEGGAPRQLTGGDANYRGASWAPDSKSIIYTADVTGNEELERNNAQIYEMNLETGAVKQLTQGKVGPYNGPSISPDGKLIAYTGYKDRYVGYQKTDLYLMNRDGSNVRVISQKLKQDVSSITWAADSKSLFFKYVEEANSKVGNIRLNGDYVTVAEHLGGMSTGVPYSGGGAYSVAGNGRFAYPVISATRPAELAVGHFPTRMANRQITHFNEEFFKTKKVGQVQEFWTNSSVDDFKIQGWVMTPPDFDRTKKYPLIIEIHGGPYLNYGPVFSPEHQFMAAKGYVVVYANPRGSTGYYEEFTAYINDNYPSEDYNDLMDAVDYAISLGFVDTDNLFITGGSGGGVLTAWSIGKTDRFKAAVVKKPVINWYSWALTADIGLVTGTQYWFSNKPWDNPEPFLKHSPLSLVGNVTTPTMVLVGENDYRTPASESEQYYGALKLQGVESTMVRIQGAGHGITDKPSNLFRVVAYVTGWFDKYRTDE